MIDPRLLRDNPDLIRAAQAKRGLSGDVVDVALAADEARRAAIVAFEELRAEQKALSKRIPQAQGDDKTALLERTKALAAEVKRILAHAIARGGTTLRDFLAPDGAPGYFEQELAAYGRGGEPCPRCGRPLKQAAIGQRASVWCGHCQR